MNGSQLYLLASSSYGTWLNCRCGPFCHTASRSRNLTETGAMDANCHHRTCQRASVVSSTATTLPCHVTVFKYQQRRGYETELIARMAAGFIVIQQPESRRKWILSGDTWEFNTASHKETSAMLPRFPEAGTCSDLSLTGAFISFEIVVVVLADKNLYLPVFFLLEGSETFTFQGWIFIWREFQQVSSVSHFLLLFLLSSVLQMATIILSLSNGQASCWKIASCSPKMSHLKAFRGDGHHLLPEPQT